MKIDNFKRHALVIQKILVTGCAGQVEKILFKK